MNRAERRRLERQHNAVSQEKVINIKKADIEKIKHDAISEALDTAFNLTIAVPVMVIHDNYSKIMKREEDGKSREERFAEMCLDLFHLVNEGYVTLEDLSKCLYEETGIRIFKDE